VTTQVQSAPRLHALLSVTEDLASAMTPREVARVIARRGLRALAADGALVLLVDDEGTHLEHAFAEETPLEEIERWRRQPLDVTHPIADAVRGAEPVILETAEAVRRRYGSDNPLLGPGGGYIALPFIVRGRAAGGVGFRFERDIEVRDEDLAFASALAKQCGLALERGVFFRREEQQRANVGKLQQVTAALARTMTVEEACGAVVDAVAEALQCPGGWLALFEPEEEEIVLAYARGQSEAMAAGWRRVRVDASGPIKDVLVAGEMLCFSSRDEWRGAYPAFSAEHDGPRGGAAALVPLLVEGEIRAVLGLRFAGDVRFDDELKDLLTAAAAECAAAIGRADLLDAERAARTDLAFLLEASRLLAASLDGKRTLQTLAELVVPRIADWCGVDMARRDGGVELQAFSHRDPAKASLALELRRQFPPTVALEEGGVGLVLQTGEPFACYRVTREMLAASEHPRELVDGMLEVGLHSTIVVPLKDGDETLGALSLGLEEGDRRFDDATLALAEEIAARAGTAIANARRHEDLRRAREEAERARKDAERARQEAERAREAAERASRVKDEFLALLGHELRNPLMPITTALTLMQLRDENAHAKERAIIARQANHLLRLVDDLLDVSRIARGHIELRRQAVEVATVLARAIETASPALEAGQHRLEVHAAQAGLRVDGDEDRLVQVFSNLLTNAAKYTPRSGRITVHARAEDSRVVVSVKDTGRGMPTDLVSRVFDMFVQGPRTIDRTEGGLGLGLAIVKNLVEFHGGEVGAWSDGPGTGSEFWVRLPLLDAPAPRPVLAGTGGPDAALDAVAPRAARRILVVDDNADAATALAEALAHVGHVVSVAHDGPSALALAGELNPEVALLDIGLPLMDGYELATRLREQHGDRLLLVAITGYGQRSDRERAYAAGFNHHHVKPIALQDLLAVVEEG
jgi:signal transduction histidine kinase